ncbi:CHAP domain-containing protein [Sinosporangium siamense]|uniref:Peptidase C51 domain-containing protein n=1 Tax=Sinosporangium siamense TaxID=1367973 RepID=A0A919RCL7_9ACTN|nr:CHAP domain-containing protein [Sinosporangium siamense]GII91193.1 hypothetical protein Ssi02_14240 [Sinosporangium siamense]
MDPIAESLLEAIRPELGYREKAGQFTKFGEWYAANIDIHPKYRNAPWCDMFLAWAADKAGVADVVGQFAWTPSHAMWFKKQNAWTHHPEPGALVFYDWSGGSKIGDIDHVGVVEKVKNGKIHTIEANVDGVWLKRKVRDEEHVVGYGVPRKVKEHIDDVRTTLITLRADSDAAQAAQAAQAATAHASGLGIPLTPQTTAVAAGVLAVLVGAVIVLRQVRGGRTPGRHRRDGKHKHPGGQGPLAI